MGQHSSLFIGGNWTTPSGAEVIDVISPHSEQVIATVPSGTPGDMDRAVAAARDAFDHGPWPRMTMAERAAMVRSLADAYAARQAEMAETITAQMGSPITFSHVGQVQQPLGMLRYFAELGAAFPVEEERPGAFGPVIVRQEPVGVVAAIVPWNVPQFSIMTKLAPALVAGCTVVIKPDPQTPLDCYLLADMIAEVGIPDGVVNIVPAGRTAGEHLVRHPGVDKVAFTGSTAAGRRIGAICGERLARCTLELGGKSAAIILDDCDLPSAMGMLTIATLLNNGQACVAQTRILASRNRYDEVVQAVADMVAGRQVGDPADPATAVGPLATQRHRERVEGYIRTGIEEGATPVVGGVNRPFDRGWYVAPTVFADVSNDMRIAREEIFGPVLTVIRYADEADAIRIANDNDYGLSGSVWTADLQHGMDIARQVRTGSYGVNMLNLMDPNTPFGGVKASGIGRELGPEGLSAYLEPKSIARLG